MHAPTDRLTDHVWPTLIRLGRVAMEGQATMGLIGGQIDN